MADDSNRIDALDFLRGTAVMGILLANMVAIGLPSAAQLNPFTLGNDGPLDLSAWTFNFLFVDGKFRALFALMFGASMLLAMESAELDGRDGAVAHRRRMIVLLGIGLAHHLLIWSGDILLPLALAGLLGQRLVRLDTLGLLKWAIGLLLLQWGINLATTMPAFWLRSAALAPGAASELVASWQSVADSFGSPGSRALAQELAIYQGHYGAILWDRFAHLGQALQNIVLFVLPETLAFMALGMAMLKGGFLAGHWAVEQYGATCRRALLVGFVPMAGLAAWVLLSGDALAAQVAGFGWAVPLRLPLAAGYAALGMALGLRFEAQGWVRAIRAIGRLALSNYLLCSLVATSLFYGYGLGLIGQWSRTMLLLSALVGWLLMMGWSMLWRRHMRQGPAEWLWRRLARGRATS